MTHGDVAMRGETPLHGGRTTPGVVRIGDTVHRPANTNSDFVRRLLEHLWAKGFGGAPRFLGADEIGREVFSFIEGEVPAELGLFNDRALCGAAALIRRLHDLAAELVTGTAETVCHNDLSPCNFVFRDGLPIAVIDFDAASPGSRAHDLGYAAWLWLDFGSSRCLYPSRGADFGSSSTPTATWTRRWSSAP